MYWLDKAEKEIDDELEQGFITVEEHARQMSALHEEAREEASRDDFY
jgi:hypothetical protein